MPDSDPRLQFLTLERQEFRRIDEATVSKNVSKGVVPVLGQVVQV